MAVKIEGKPEDVKRYREMLHKAGTYTKRYKKEIDLGVMEPKPDDYRVLKASFKTVKAEPTDEGGGQPDELMKIVGVANENAVDRMDERLEPAGVTIDNFIKNPVLLADHLYFTRAVIGAVENVTPEDDGVKFVANLGDPSKAELTETQKEIRSLVKQGLIQTVSVGFIPLRIRAPEFDDDYKLIEPAVILEWELLEISVVAVPANAGSTFEMKNIAERLGYTSHAKQKNNSNLLTNANGKGENKPSQSTKENLNVDEIKELLEKLLTLAEKQAEETKGLADSLKELGTTLSAQAKGDGKEDDKMDDEDEDEMEKSIKELKDLVASHSEKINQVAEALLKVSERL